MNFWKEKLKLAVKGAGLAILGWALAPAMAEIPALTNTAAPAATEQSTPSSSPPRDLVAARFLTMCAGCHSLSGAKLSGPELTPAAAWPVEQLKAAIKKMETKVGPLSEPVVTELPDLIQAPEVRDRLKLESERIAALFMAKMEPANPALGRELFRGGAPLKNGGLACAACHATEGQGGNLGPALDAIFKKTGGELPLISAIEQANFKIMLPHYRRHPVTKQEAMHLAKYLSLLDPAKASAPAPAFASVGAGCALAALAGMIVFLKKQRASRRRDIPLQARRK